MNNPGFKPTHGLLLCLATLLSACGGGGETPVASGDAVVAAPLASATTTLQLDATSLPDAVAALAVLPSFHLAPAVLDEPSDDDRAYSDASASQRPHAQGIPAEYAGLSTRRLTPQALESRRALSAAGLVADGTVVPMASTGSVTTYTPAQIRAAYSLPALPTTGATLTATQAAQLGAGQTIYLIDAMSDPNIAAELAAFNTKFGLPTCTTTTLASSASLPLAAASSSACQFSVVYSNAAGKMNATAPAYDSSWATEIALDVQWAHATAPLARIVLIEAPDASLSSFTGAIQLANSMGVGVVSMSFGATEGNWTASVDSNFTHANMTYLAAAGDSGASVQWPAVSSNVLAVGGTTLTYSGTGSRSEVAWSGTGGGVSLYTATPGYQNGTVPGMGTVSHRSVTDVSFNADPSTGQYLAVIPKGSSTASWYSVGGTSLATPQWAGILAIANAQRAAAAKAAVGLAQSVLYGQVASVAGNYASAFADITRGSDGSCITCYSKVGYDQPTGLGTPNVISLLATLSGASVAAAPPLVSAASIAGTVGTALSFTVSVTNAYPVTYSLSGAPSGMAISSAGIVTWATPLAGSYAVTVTATDPKTGLSGSGLYSVTIAAPQPPVVGSATISGQPGVALSFSVSVTDANPVTYALGGAPSGMSISAAGVISWPKPVAGSYTVTVIANDSKTGLSSQGVYKVMIATAGPVITAPAMTGVVGKSLSGTISIADATSTSLSLSISGAPLGMSFSVSGLTITATWASPVLGSYSLKVSVVDSARLTAQATVPITITAK